MLDVSSKVVEHCSCCSSRPGQLINLINNRDYWEMTIMLTIIVMSIIHIVLKEKCTRKYILPQKYNVDIVTSQNKVLKEA